MKTEREVWVVTDKHGSYYATTEEEARNMATPGDEVTRYIPATPSPAGQSEAQKWLESELDWYTARVLPGAVGQCDATVIRGLLRAAMDVTHEAGTPEGTRAAVMDTVTQSAHVLYGCLGEAGYLQRYESQSEQSPAGQTCPDCAEHCHDFQAIASALGILDELPDTPRVLERAAELLAAESEQSPARLDAWAVAVLDAWRKNALFVTCYGKPFQRSRMIRYYDDAAGRLLLVTVAVMGTGSPGDTPGSGLQEEALWFAGETDAVARLTAARALKAADPSLGPAEPAETPCLRCKALEWDLEQIATALTSDWTNQTQEGGLAMKVVAALKEALFAATDKLAEPVERSGWKPVLDSKGAVRCDEGETYLFAIQVSTNGAPAHWEYFSDAIIWDSESDPQWSDGNCGWEIGDDGLYFRPLPAPPAVDAKGGKL